MSLAFLIAGFSVVTVSLFQALGKGIYSLIISAARQLLALLPLAYVLSLTGKLDLVWLSLPLAEVVSAVVTLCLYIKLRKKLDGMMAETASQRKAV